RVDGAHRLAAPEDLGVATIEVKLELPGIEHAHGDPPLPRRLEEAPGGVDGGGAGEDHEAHRCGILRPGAPRRYRPSPAPRSSRFSVASARRAARCRAVATLFSHTRSTPPVAASP